jgi:ATP-dependent exoDNAse (exonuclease V) beta subunit
MIYKEYNLTDEQYTYIIYPNKIDTKLVACAGSGKTQVIILRTIYMIENNIYKSDEILLLVFGRMARQDIITRATSIDENKLINLDLIMTIDSFSKFIIDDNNRIDVSLLSYKFMLYLQNTSKEDLINNEKLNNIKCIFIDEAQDLNEIQFTILKLLQEKLNITLHFIGDPNQNIFQFRYSESKYFIEFQAIEFKLTTNFRSHAEIINFSNKLRHDQTHQIISNKGYNNIKPIFYEGDFESTLINIISELEEITDLSDIAILSPVKGKIGLNHSDGLCLAANTLSKYNIKFKQFYDESKDDASNNIKYEHEPGACVLMTICGSKGLQWKHVILIGAKPCLINYYKFTEKQHNDERNQLYVAATRAIESLSIIIKTNEKSMSINHWFNEIDKNDYDIISENNYNELKYPPIRYNNEPTYDNKITKILDNFPLEILNELSNIIDYDNLLKHITKIYDYDFTKTEYVSPIFLGKYVESLFINLIHLKNNEQKKEYKDIHNIASSINVIECDKQKTYDWIMKNKSKGIKLTWEYIDEIKNTLPSDINNELTLIKNRNKNNLQEFDKYSFVLNNQYYKQFVKSNIEHIRKFYKKYSECTDFNKLKKLQFYCEVFTHAIQTQHYYHIQNRGIKFKQILLKYFDMFEQMKLYVDNMQHNFIEHNTYIENYNLSGEIDLISDKNELFEIKAAQDINLKYILQLLMYNIINNKLENVIENNYRLNFINFLKGEEVIVNLNINNENKENLIKLFQQYSWN